MLIIMNLEQAECRFPSICQISCNPDTVAPMASTGNPHLILHCNFRRPCCSRKACIVCSASSSLIFLFLFLLSSEPRDDQMRFISMRPISLILSPFWKKKKQRKEAFYPPRYFRGTNELILQLSVNCLKRKLGNVWSFNLQIIKRKTTSNMEDNMQRSCS